MEKFRIDYCGQITEVYINFFINLNIKSENKIGDTYFITCDNINNTMTFSIHKTYYDKVKIELRNNKIDTILND